jgi:DNA-binding transcriptional ArsR family regulator
MELSNGQPRSISQLTHGSLLTRQAVTKHLRVLKRTGIVRSTHSGRENLFELDTAPFKNMTEYLEFVSTQWDQALLRLKSLVED